MPLRSKYARCFLDVALIAALTAVSLAGCGKQGESDASADGGSGNGNGNGGTASSGSAADGVTGGRGHTGGDPGGSSGGIAAGTGASGMAGARATAGDLIDDSVITTKLKAALLADATLKGASISVETRNGEAVLTGAVNNQTQHEHAAQIARAIHGVKNVNNKLAMKQ